jgi:thymidylate synthase
MLTITGEDANELFIQTSRLLLKTGQTRITRGLETLEIPDEICLTLLHPRKSIITLPPRHPDLRKFEYLEAELRWFLSGSLDITPILPYSSFWKQICNQDQSINSNYGYYAFYQKNQGLSQFDWCRERLIADPWSRQAVINFNQPQHKYPNNRDFVCTVGQQFIRRGDKLDSIVWMRSNDLIYGTTFNLPWFSYLHQKMADTLNMPLGKYSHIASTMHVYQKHYPLLRSLAEYQTSEQDRLNAEKIWNYWQLFLSDPSRSFCREIAEAAVLGI